jgi:hypothetical protein
MRHCLLLACLTWLSISKQLELGTHLVYCYTFAIVDKSNEHNVRHRREWRVVSSRFL